MKVLELISGAWLLFPFVPDVVVLSILRKKAQTSTNSSELNVYHPGSGSQVKNEVANFYPNFLTPCWAVGSDSSQVFF